ncbi:hypothetical protein BVX99_02370 [bacterium F16]|nr:hypothetical protein BVX99_02370 [bacterium F16]
MTNTRKLTTRAEATDVLPYSALNGQVNVECVVHNETIKHPNFLLSVSICAGDETLFNTPFTVAGYDVQ